MNAYDEDAPPPGRPTRTCSTSSARPCARWRVPSTQVSSARPGELHLAHARPGTPDRPADLRLRPCARTVDHARRAGGRPGARVHHRAALGGGRGPGRPCPRPVRPALRGRCGSRTTAESSPPPTSTSSGSSSSSRFPRASSDCAARPRRHGWSRPGSVCELWARTWPHAPRAMNDPAGKRATGSLSTARRAAARAAPRSAPGRRCGVRA